MQDESWNISLGVISIKGFFLAAEMFFILIKNGLFYAEK